jgi:hypothetical protein
VALSSISASISGRSALEQIAHGLGIFHMSRLRRYVTTGFGTLSRLRIFRTCAGSYSIGFAAKEASRYDLQRSVSA